MGINYTDDISGEVLDADLAYQMSFVKFESNGKKMIKSKKFYIGLKSLKTLLGGKDPEWTTRIKKGDDWFDE